jgi:hypothetical protein
MNAEPWSRPSPRKIGITTDSFRRRLRLRPLEIQGAFGDSKINGGLHDGAQLENECRRALIGCLLRGYRQERFAIRRCTECPQLEKIASRRLIVGGFKFQGIKQRLPRREREDRAGAGRSDAKDTSDRIFC